MAVVAALNSGTPTPTPNGGQVAASTGVFLSDSSLTFPGAAVVCSILLGGINIFVAGAASDARWVLGVCCLVGAFILWRGWPIAGSARDKGGFVFIGIVNTALLFTSLMGVSAIATNQVPSV